MSLTGGSSTAITLQRVGERFRTVRRILYSNNTPKSGREVPHCPIASLRSHILIAKLVDSGLLLWIRARVEVFDFADRYVHHDYE